METAFDLAPLTTLKEETLQAIAAASQLSQLETLRVGVLGKKGSLVTFQSHLKTLPVEQKRLLGEALNHTQTAITQALGEKTKALQALQLAAQLAEETLDITMPPGPLPPQEPGTLGATHPIALVMNQVSAIFQTMGFSVLPDSFCPEVETDYFNFEALNFPAHHPARDMQDTFYLSNGALLRSQTSNAQIRAMLANPIAPGTQLRILSPGRVYRNEEVNSRKNVLFHQIEGLLVGEHCRFSDLKGVLQVFAEAFFGNNTQKTRFRPSFFPFTEPSAEVDVSCIFCSGHGLSNSNISCKVCGQTGWLEIMGCGMVDPAVLEGVGIDAERYSGFAFGMGVERLAMLKYRIHDIRLFYQNHPKFLQQFIGEH